MGTKRIFLKDGVIDHYVAGKSIYKTAEHYGYAVVTLYRLLKDAGVDTKLDKVRHSQLKKKYPIDDNYFEKIDTRDKAYILGIISSDGHLYKNRKQLRIKLTDIELLEEICKRMNYDKPLISNKKYKESHKDSKTMIICNVKIYNDLIAAGIQQNKSYTNTFPKLERHLIPDFIRGFFDGNGSITVCRNASENPVPIMEITSSLVFCQQLNKILLSFGIHSLVERDKRTNERIGKIRVRRTRDAILFYYFIYRKIFRQIFLRRKKEKYDMFIEERKNTAASKQGSPIQFSSIKTSVYDNL